MQFVKNCLLSQQQSYDRKFNEIVLAVVVTTLFSKSEVLTMYLNTAYFGGGAYGIEVAARKFFGRSVGYEPQINLYEAALLAKSVKSPSTINPISNRPILEARARGLIRVMAAQGETAGLSEGPRSPGNRSWSMRPYLFRDLALRFLLPAGLEDR
jgi:membrane peptidoglycan carboxypeptidase